MTTAVATMSSTHDIPRGVAVSATINSEPVVLNTLIDPKTGSQCLLFDRDGGIAKGRVFWMEDNSAPTGRRVIYQYVEKDAVTGGDKVDEKTKKPFFYFCDVYARKDGSLVPMRREVDADNQTLSVSESKGGNSKTHDRYLKKGFHWASPEEYLAAIDRAEFNAKAYAEAKKKSDPKRQWENLAETLKEALGKPITAGARHAALAQAEADDKAAEEAAAAEQKKQQGVKPDDKQQHKK